MPDKPGDEYVYTVNADDEIIEIQNQAMWEEFARSGDAPHLQTRAVLGKPLWDYIQDKPTRKIFRFFMQQVRQRSKVLVMPFRCDAPNLRRYMQLRLEPLPDDHVRFHSRMQRLEPRDDVPLLAADTPRSNDLIIICSICKKLKVAPDTWQEVEHAIATLGLFHNTEAPRLANGICPACVDNLNLICRDQLNSPPAFDNDMSDLD